MAIRALFFDIDGTLVSFKTHRIPPSTVASLTKAKEKGVKIFISTGRPTQFITNLQQIEHLIDGWVTTNGANCFIGTDTVHRKAMSRENVDHIIALSDKYQVPVIIVGSQDIAVHNYNPQVDILFREGLGVVNIDFTKLDIEDLKGQDILQMTPFFNQAMEEKLMPQLSNCTAGRWCDDFIDITALGADKGEGIEAIARHQGITIDDTMAFGDGGNDNTMIIKAGIGVAMGNANEGTKKIADYITTGVDDEGIQHALQYYHII